MRIAFLTHEPFYPPSGGGSAEAVYLVEEFVRRGHGVHVFCPALLEPNAARKRFGIQLHEFTAWEMSRYTSLRNLKYVLYPFLLERMVRREAARAKFDLIFSQHAISAVAAGRLKRALGTTVVTNFLDFLTAFMETWPARMMPPRALHVLKNFELSIPRRYGIDAVLTVSDTLAALFAKSGYAREKIHPIYYGYDADLFPFRGPIQHAPPGPGVVSMHGSFDRHHLGPIAGRMIDVVTRARPGTQFQFIGRKTPALEAFVKRARSDTPSANVACAGFIPYDKVAGHLAAATVGLVPYEESTGTHCAFVAKIVEYLGVGLPVASTPLQSASQYFRDERTVRFSKFDGDSLAREVLHWLNEPPADFLEASKAASERVRRELDWRAISRKAVDFVEVIRERSGGPMRASSRS